MGTEGNILQSTFKYLSEAKKYYRYSDHATVTARLVEIDGKKLMQSRQKPSDTSECPGCGLLLSLVFDRMPPTYLRPVEFHGRHRPMAEKK